MADEISIAQVDQATARLDEAKQQYENGDITQEQYQQIKQEAVDVRTAWRIQEENAGRRGGMIGGDAVQSGG